MLHFIVELVRIDFAQNRFFVDDLEQIAARYADVHGMGTWEWEDVLRALEGRLSLNQLENLYGGVYMRAYNEFSSLVERELELRKRARQKATRTK